MSLQGKVAIVTGSGRGIGAACAVLLAKQGAKVVLNYLRNQEAAETLLQRIKEAGGTATIVQADVMSEEGANLLAKTAIDAYGSIDILVSNAGPLFGPIPFEHLTWDAFSDNLIKDMKATFFSTKAVLQTMIQNHYGRIVYIGGMGSKRPNPSFVHHGSARAALTTFAQYVAKEMGPNGITANVVAPGLVETDRTTDFPEWREHIASLTPVQRIATPDDVARVVAFFAEDEKGFYTGTFFPVDGGLNMG
jgi:3-oxoacyl-[acyl-carrier protein] reductase